MCSSPLLHAMSINVIFQQKHLPVMVADNGVIKRLCAYGYIYAISFFPKLTKIFRCLL